MNKSTILILAIAFLTDYVIRKYFPEIWRKLQLPLNAAITVLDIAFAALLIYSIFPIIKSGVTITDKVIYFIGILICILILISTCIYMWKRWLKERKELQSTLDKPKS